MNERAIKNRRAILKGKHPEDGAALASPVKVLANTSIRDFLNIKQQR